VHRAASNDYMFYVVCRKDEAKDTEYSVNAVVVDSIDQFPDKIKAIMSDRKNKLGPVYYGVYGNWELWYVRQEKGAK